MSKFVITNSSSSLDYIIRQNTMFSISEKFDVPNIKSVCFDKISVHHENVYHDDRGGIIYIVGTPLVRDGLNIDNIAKYIYDSFEKGVSCIGLIKKAIVGMWAAMIVKDGIGYVFNDYYGLYDICYSKSNGDYYISNSLADICLCEPHLTFNEYAFIMEAFQGGAFPGETIFEGIKKIKSDECLLIDHDQMKLVHIEVSSEKYNYTNEDNALRDIAEMSRIYAKKIDAAYAPEGIGMTGGLDSRLVFAAFNAVGADFSCVHGVSSVTYSGDKVIVEQICKAYNKELEFHDWQQPKAFNLKDQESVFAEVGFNNFIAAGCKAHFSKFKEEAKRHHYHLAGYFGEAIRLRDWAEKKGSFFSLYDYVDNYFINKALKSTYSNYDNYRNYVIDEHKKQLRSLGYEGDENAIPIDFFESFRWIMSRFSDTRSVFNTNIYRFCYPLMGFPQIHEAVLSLPAKVIKGSKFQIKLLCELDKGLITKFDIFSHNRPWKIIRGKKIRKMSKANLADIIAESFPFIRPTLRRVYRNLRNKEGYQRNAMLNDIDSMRYLLPQYIEIDNYKESLIRLRAILIGCNYLNNKMK